VFLLHFGVRGEWESLGDVLPLSQFYLSSTDLTDRLAFGRQELNNVKNVGCMPYWMSLDPGVTSRGAPLDLLYWKSGALTYPSAGVSLTRKR
jgi:hypothetical protein